MELDELRNDWKAIHSSEIELSQLKNMLNEKSHPVLSGARKQLMIELLGWLAFLVLCFTGLDAQQKPLLTNMILVTSIIMPALFNVYGHQLTKDLIAGPDIRSSMLSRIMLLRRFVTGTVVFRLMLIAGVGYFLISTIHLNERKLILLGATSLILIFQLYLLVRIWNKRITKLTDTLTQLVEI